MNINSNQHANNLYAQTLAQGQHAKAAAEPLAQSSKQGIGETGEKANLSLLDQLRNQPEIRPEVVAKGKELLNDPNFPSQEMVNEIAKLIVPFADDE